MCSRQVTRLLLRSASVTTDSAIAASCDEPLAAGRVGRTPRGGSTHLVPAATVTTGAKPHGQQQLARDLEVERAAMGQRCRPQSSGPGLLCAAARFGFAVVKNNVSLLEGLDFTPAASAISNIQLKTFVTFRTG